MSAQKVELAALRALATDFDGTLAHNGTVTKATLAALQKLQHAGFHLILVTGRELHDLTAIFPEITWFDIAVMENGAVLYHPDTGQCEALAAPAPSSFVAHLYERGLPLQVGEVILATWEPHEKVVLEAIKEFGLELQVIFNKGAVMVLPSGVNKATGLRQAAERLSLDMTQIAGIGDAENDHAFLEVCGFSAAVGNALPAIKQRVDEVMHGDHGKGVEELIDRLLAAVEAPQEDSPV
jgi:hydroxymethylpyrimidine pyrophosphatase-like HAD family hydrolase